ncbi:hypothetical protein JKP88DRAFT_232834 [Tribonema minus]|uniref:Large ribosomal subunit protein bL32m n=1 Tax=Tribonema minus TaxID=303371 RepID=A0A835ZJ37_9STRA|nr:hypothetical protein JKP88DRAFT_232834 [Tribonema minus]
MLSSALISGVRIWRSVAARTSNTIIGAAAAQDRITTAVREALRDSHAWREYQPSLELAGAPGDFMHQERRQDQSSVWESVFGPLWFAVPKTKVSPGRKRQRGYHRAPKRITNISTCEACGKPKLTHKLCKNYELCARVHAPQR